MKNSGSSSVYCRGAVVLRGEEMASVYEKCTVAKLKQELKVRNAKTNGRKVVLLGRYVRSNYYYIFFFIHYGMFFSW